MSAILTLGLNPTTAAPYAYDTSSRLEALLAENAEFKRRRALYRTPLEEIDSIVMRAPLTATQAYGYLGLFLGIFPPAAYFIQMGYGNIMFPLFLFMNAVCALIGWKMGSVFGASAQRFERSSWSKMIGGVTLLALGWAAVTGFSGGAIVLLIGGIFGAFFAAPVAVAGFLMFALMHRLLERGNLIERSHVLPLAIGISMTIGAFILGYR